jgi:IS5 family transposase
MDCFNPKGSEGDALYAVLCAAGYNIRWLLRMIIKKSLGLLLCLLQESGLAGLFKKLTEVFDINRLQNLDQRWVLT